MNILTKDQILSTNDLTKELVEVPEWGGAVYVRTMTGAERDSFEAQILGDDYKERNYRNVRATLCSLTIVDEDGKRLFSDAEVTKLGAKSAAAIDRIFNVAQRLNGLSKDDVEDLAKN
jgi:hypothetical protein